MTVILRKKTKKDIIDRINKYKINGNFILSSGIKSNIYYDIKSLMTNPLDLLAIREELISHIANNYDSIDYIGGMEIGSIPLSTSLSELFLVPSFIIRKEEKKYGIKDRIICCKEIYGDILIVEDVISTGKAVKDVIKILRECNQKNSIKAIYCIVNRSNINKIDEIPVFSLI